MKNYKTCSEIVSGLKIIAFIFLLLTMAYSGLYSSELMISADRNSGKGIDFSVYWLQEKWDIDINASSVEEIRALNLDATVSTFSGTAENIAKYELKEKTSLPAIKFSVRFGEKFHPYIKFGISKTELTGYGKKWESRQEGITGGFGLKYVLLQDTVITPAFAVDTGIFFKNVKIKKFDGTDIDLNYKTHEIATSFWTSKKMKQFEPYLGLQFSFIDGEFENCDIDADSVNIFYGCGYEYPYKFLSGINFVFENSFVNIKNFNFSTGIKVKI